MAGISHPSYSCPRASQSSAPFFRHLLKIPAPIALLGEEESGGSTKVQTGTFVFHTQTMHTDTSSLTRAIWSNSLSQRRLLSSQISFRAYNNNNHIQYKPFPELKTGRPPYPLTICRKCTLRSFITFTSESEFNVRSKAVELRTSQFTQEPGTL